MIIKHQRRKTALSVVSAMFVLSVVGWALADTDVAGEAADPNSQSPSVAATTSTSTTTTTTIPPLDGTLCEGTYVPSDAENTEGSLGIMGRSNLVNDCKALVAIRNHFITNTPNLSPNHFLRKWGTYLSIQGDPTNPTNKIGFWPGVSIERVTVNTETQTRVTGIHLSNSDLISDTTMKLSGSLPIVHILKLTELRSLHLSNNMLTGSISDEFGKKTDGKVKLVNLLELTLDNNNLTGSIPANIFNLENLETLNLSNNSLSSSIPTTLGKLSKLYRLMLNDNNLTGNIPALGKLTQLYTADLSDNKLSGPIPALGKLTKLRWIDLSDNELTGPIPALGKLTKLRRIDLSDNKLEQQVPTLVKLTKLIWIDLSNNQLIGGIRAQFNNLSELEHLDLSNNSLSGTTPTNICALGTKAKLTNSGLTACS